MNFVVIFCFVCLVTSFTEEKHLKQVWDLAGRRLFNFEGHEAPVYSICPHQKENIQVSKLREMLCLFAICLPGN